MEIILLQALRCRTGNQQSNEQFRKVMQTCRRRNLNNGKNADYSNESDSDGSDSDEDMFDKRFLSGVSRKNNTYSYGNESNNRYLNMFHYKFPLCIFLQKKSFQWFLKAWVTSDFYLTDIFCNHPIICFNYTKVSLYGTNFFELKKNIFSKIFFRNFKKLVPYERALVFFI